VTVFVVGYSKHNDAFETRYVTLALRKATPWMKTGERLVVGLVGCIWTGVQGSDGVCADRVDITTVYEDHPHGANMQCTVILRNLRRANLCSNRLPERLTVSADNTVKETKNNTTLCFFIWLLCYFANSNLWCVRTVYKMVGHTHDNLDRFFSRVAMALRGRSYISQSEMQDIVSRTLSSYRIAWSHSNNSYNFESTIRQQLGLHVKRLRNLHDVEIFRTDGGIFMRWKQWMTDEAWSLPRKLLDFDQIENVAKMKPAEITHQFDASKANSGFNLVAKLEAELQASSGISSSSADALRELKSIWRGETVKQAELLDEVLSSLGGCASGSMANHSAALVSSSAAVPSDILYQSCPGHDVVGVPVETLVEISNPNTQQSHHNGTHQSSPSCVLGDVLIARAEDCKSKLPFFLGVLRDISSDGAGLVEWLHPLKTTECKFASGKKKQMLDIFGAWVSVDSLILSDIENLPSPVIRPPDVLLWGFDFTDNSEIPFSVLDSLLDDHGLDFTGLSLSATARGNLYRTHRLMQGARNRS
jgi:hypothetical protein